MRKKLIICILTLALFLFTPTLPGNIPALLDTAVSADSVSGFWSYTDIDDGTVHITAYSGFSDNLVVPDELDGKKVSGIANHAFAQNMNIGKVTLPKDISFIGYGAFRESSVTSIGIPSSVTWGLQLATDETDTSYAFADCKSLKTVTVNTETIPNSTFKGCSALKTLTLGKNVKDLKEKVFQGCTSLSKLNVKGKLQHIGRYAFADCSSLKKFNFNICDSIGGGAFSNTGLTSVTIPESVSFYGGNYLAYQSMSHFSGCQNLKKVEINTVVVPSNAFENCPNLKTVILGSNTHYIHYSAFKNDSKLRSVKVKTDLYEIHESAFQGCSSLKNFNFGSRLYILGKHSFENTGLEFVALPSSISNWGDNGYHYHQFCSCPNLTSVAAANSTAPNIQTAFEKTPLVQFICIPDTPVYNFCNKFSLPVESTYKGTSAKSIEFGKKEYTLVMGDTLTLNPEMTPANSTDAIYYTSGNNAIAEISPAGVVTPKAEGLVAVKVTTTSGKVATCSINVVGSGKTDTDTLPKRDITVSMVIGVPDSAQYTGKELKPTLRVMFNEVTQLIEDVDYTLSYSNNIDVGKATIKVKGKGRYSGTLTKSFNILPQTPDRK